MTPTRSDTSAGGKPNVSVALCTYNGASYVRQQLDSILAQTVAPFEIVVSDDASTDGTLDEVRAVLTRPEMRRRGITVRILTRKTGLGVTKNFEAAIAACSGEFIALCDQDDVWHPRHIEALLAPFAEGDVLVVHSDARLVDATGAPLRHSLMQSLGASRRELHDEQGPDGFRTLLRRNLVTGATAMVRTTHARAVRPFEPTWVHDHWLAITAALRGRVAFVDEKLLDYRQHGANQIGVSKLTASGAVDLLAQSRRARHDDRVNRILALNTRIEDGTVPATPAQAELVRAKLAHEQRRRDMPDQRWRRVGPVAREWVSGRYGRLSRGLIDVVRDLFSAS